MMTPKPGGCRGDLAQRRSPKGRIAQPALHVSRSRAIGAGRDEVSAIVGRGRFESTEDQVMAEQDLQGERMFRVQRLRLFEQWRRLCRSIPRHRTRPPATRQ